MKRLMTGLLAVLMTCLLCIPALAAGNGSYTMAIQVNGKSSVTVKPGATITVTLVMSKDNEDAFDLYSMQDYVRFDTEHFSYVEGSLSAYTTSGSKPVQVFSAGVIDFPDSDGEDNAVFVNRASDSAQTLSSGVTAISFQLKAVSTGTSTLTHSTAEIFRTSGSLYDTTLENATVTISSNAPADDETDEENPDQEQDPDQEQPGDQTPGGAQGSGAGLPFVDVARNSWYRDAVEYVYEKGLMSGVSATRFDPAANLTRGMIAQVLYNLEGTAGSYPAVFTDVASGSWYAKAVNWAAANGIVEGYGNGKFGPNDPITREQMAAILYRYSAFKGYDVSAAASLSAFSDAGRVSGWANAALSWTVAQGLISGKGNGVLDPTGTATRAEVAQILMNYCTQIL